MIVLADCAIEKGTEVISVKVLLVALCKSECKATESSLLDLVPPVLRSFCCATVS